MKKVFQLVLVAVCFFVGSSTRVMAGDEIEKDPPSVPIPIGSGEILTGNDAKGVVTVPFIAYYQGGTIYISSSAEFSSIYINVLNETTGQVWSATVDVTDGMGEISIANGGAGSYTVEIVTEYGECFVGDFEL